jgi:hypothetical protein
VAVDQPDVTHPPAAGRQFPLFSSDIPLPLTVFSSGRFVEKTVAAILNGKI